MDIKKSSIAFKNKNTWNTIKVNKILELMKTGDYDGISPFYEKNYNYRAAELVFEYTDEELKELVKSASDVVYFTNSHGVTMTDDGIRPIKLRDYQEDILKMYQEERFSCLLASRQIGKCIEATSVITIKNSKGLIQKISAYKLFYSLKTNKNIFDYIKEKLHDLESLLIHGQIFKLII